MDERRSQGDENPGFEPSKTIVLRDKAAVQAVRSLPVINRVPPLLSKLGETGIGVVVYTEQRYSLRLTCSVNQVKG
jgi:hypothetical protein